MAQTEKIVFINSDFYGLAEERLTNGILRDSKKGKYVDGAALRPVHYTDLASRGGSSSNIVERGLENASAQIIVAHFGMSGDTLANAIYHTHLADSEGVDTFVMVAKNHAIGDVLTLPERTKRGQVVEFSSDKRINHAFRKAYNANCTA